METDAANGDGPSRPTPRLSWSLFLAALVAVPAGAVLVEAGEVSLAWLAVGVLSWAAGAGPVAASQFGQRVGSWFESIGSLGRAVAIFSFAGATVTLLAWFHPPSVPIHSFVLGGMGGLAAVALWRAFRPD